jgi:nucleoid-associated protein YgaU
MADGKKSGSGGIILLLAALIIPGAVYVSTRQSDSPVKLSSSPAPSKPAQIRDAPDRLVPPPTFDAVNADENGMLVAAGKGPAGWNIQLLNASQTLGESQANEDGEWVVLLERPLDPGDYVLSLLAKGPPGQAALEGRRTFALTVAPRRKTAPPSQQIAGPAAAAAQIQPAAGSQAEKVATVKAGDSLWVLAHKHLGSGMLYREIVRANQSKIKNPDLIYPDQKFAMPR